MFVILYNLFCFFFVSVQSRCEECGSMFAIKSRLQTHKNTVHNERLHTCDVCNKSFQSQSLVKRHMVIHSRVKPYSCPFCNHSSNSQSNLTKHVRNIHSKENFSYHKSVLLTILLCYCFCVMGRLKVLISIFFVIIRFINGKQWWTTLITSGRYHIAILLSYWTKNWHFQTIFTFVLFDSLLFSICFSMARFYFKTVLAVLYIFHCLFYVYNCILSNY